MIQVNECRVSNDNKNIYIDVITDDGYNFTSIKLWTDQTFKVLLKAKDIPFSGADNKEVLVVTSASLGLARFDGIYFIEFESNAPGEECDTCPNPVTAVVTNLVSYYRCGMDMLLKASKSCLNIFSGEICDSGDANNAMSVHLLIDGVNECIKLNRFVDAISLLGRLRTICASCTNCIPVTGDDTNFVECSSCNQTSVYYS
jgi:hypothetical protein